MSRLGNSAVQRILAIGRMTESEAKAFLASEKQNTKQTTQMSADNAKSHIRGPVFICSELELDGRCWLIVRNTPKEYAALLLARVETADSEQGAVAAAERFHREQGAARAALDNELNRRGAA